METDQAVEQFICEYVTQKHSPIRESAKEPLQKTPHLTPKKRKAASPPEFYLNAGVRRDKLFG